jgi:formiminoglutamate deiminase
MYREAAKLEPASYERLATAVYAEMVVAGWTGVAEFHYLHHRPDGSPYGEPHAMELALARAARAAGIRLTLLDACYLAGGFDQPLEAGQRRFGDGDAAGWLNRLGRLRGRIAAEFAPDQVIVGAALHSVRAAPERELAVIAAELPPDLPLHVHLSEQPAENEACLAATGLTPTGLLASRGLVCERLSVVHATHLTGQDIALLGAFGVTAVLCPSTEADLGDGIGPARALADAGAALALGSDQQAVVDPFAEARALEYGQRLASGRRGLFSQPDLVAALGVGGARAAGRSAPPSGDPAGGIGPEPAQERRAAAGGASAGGLPGAGQAGVLRVGAWCDLVAVDDGGVRTQGSAPEQLIMSATSADVAVVVVGGRVVAERGVHVELGDVGALLRAAMVP